MPEASPPSPPLPSPDPVVPRDSSVHSAVSAIRPVGAGTFLFTYFSPTVHYTDTFVVLKMPKYPNCCTYCFFF